MDGLESGNDGPHGLSSMGDMADDRKLPWFVESRLGRFAVLDRRGAAAFGLLMLVLMAGAAAESLLRPDHPALALLVMAPLAVIAIGLVLLILDRTRR